MFNSKTKTVVAGLLWCLTFAATTHAHPQPVEGVAVSDAIEDIGMFYFFYPQHLSWHLSRERKANQRN